VERATSRLPLFNSLLALPALAQDDPGLVVHEWGVVTIAYGSEFGVARSEGARFEGGREIGEQLPPFVTTYRQAFDQSIESWRNRPVRKPVVYFHAKKATRVTMKVSMPHGRPEAWWPAAQYAPQPDLKWGKGFGAVEPPPSLESMKPENGALVWQNLARGARRRDREAPGARPARLPYDPRRRRKDDGRRGEGEASRPAEALTRSRSGACRHSSHAPGDVHVARGPHPMS